jgi:hypothetical protein
MKKTAFLLTALLLAFSTFAAYRTMHKKKKKQTRQSAATVKNDTKIKSVLMGRSACFGTCPVYKIEVFETGLLRYTGESYVDKEGVYEKNIGPDAAIKFIRQFNTIRPDTLHFLYETKIADLPGFHFFITYPDSVKRVINADSGPVILREWAQKFDDLAKVDDSWQKQNTNNIKK